MTCMEAQALITPFINDKLDVGTLEQFLDHVENCDECKEELEVYYALLTAMRQLDEDEELTIDFARELEHKIKEAQELILKKKLIHIRKRFLFVVVVLMVGLFTSVSVSVVEEALVLDEKITFNSFVLKNETLSPYMGNTILNEMKDYQKVLADVAIKKEQTRQQEEQLKEERKKIQEEKRKRQLKKANLNAKEAMNLNYLYPSRYSRTYEMASKWISFQLDDEMTIKNNKKISIETPKEYSR